MNEMNKVKEQVSPTSIDKKNEKMNGDYDSYHHESSSSSNSYCPRMDRICNNVLDCIGNTPMIRLNRVGVSTCTTTFSATSTSTTSAKINECCCELLVKCEFFNAGGSVKDRIGKSMIIHAEQNHLIQPNKTTLIEPTSGNTGIGIALAAAIKGYKCIITMPEKMSKEKVDVLKALGAQIVRTPTEAAYDAPDSHISVAKRLCADTDHAYILDQYSNPSNPGAHYYGTAEEIIRQCSGSSSSSCYDNNDNTNNKPIDMFVAGAGTGGTITGIAKRLKEVYPNIIIVGVDPIGSILALPDTLNDSNRLESYQVEGIGYDFIPDVLDRSPDVIDMWIKTTDHESLVMMRRLIRDEGLLCGGSSGAAVCAAIKAIQLVNNYDINNDYNNVIRNIIRKRNNKKIERCVIILPDSVRNYMTKALSDDWMSDHGFIDGDVIKLKTSYQQSWWATKKVYEMNLNTPLTITSNVRCKDAIALLKQEGFDMVPVLDNQNGGTIIGVVTEGNITKCILSGRCNPNTPIADSGVIYKTFHKFTMNSTLGELANALDHDPFVLIVTEQRCFSFVEKNSPPPMKKQKLLSNSNSFDSLHDDKNLNNISSNNSIDGGVHGGSRITSPLLSSSSAPLSAATATKAQMMTRCVVSGIVSRIDLLDFISSGETQRDGE